jgi:hypothetical protein
VGVGEEMAVEGATGAGSWGEVGVIPPLGASPGSEHARDKISKRARVRYFTRLDWGVCIILSAIIEIIHDR